MYVPLMIEKVRMRGTQDLFPATHIERRNSPLDFTEARNGLGV
jgi:hypothetical protein